MAFRVVIPARFASTRLPGKPLADIAGKPMVVRVAETAAGSGAAEIWVATDDQRVFDAVEAAGHQVLLTRADHPSGTDRLAEVAATLGWAANDIVVNVQGDEPLIDPALIGKVAAALESSPDAAMATAAHPLTDIDQFLNPNIVKVVLGDTARALYFSRAPIPWPRDAFANHRNQLPPGFPARRHIGIYAYRVSFLQAYGALPAAPVEQWESLEQLRALAAGFAIQVVDVEHAPAPGVDTPEDLERVRQIYAQRV